MLSSSVGYLSQTLQMAHNKKEYKARSIYKQVKKKTSNTLSIWFLNCSFH